MRGRHDVALMIEPNTSHQGGRRHRRVFVAGLAGCVLKDVSNTYRAGLWLFAATSLAAAFSAFIVLRRTRRAFNTLSEVCGGHH